MHDVNLWRCDCVSVEVSGRRGKAGIPFTIICGLEIEINSLARDRQPDLRPARLYDSRRERRIAGEQDRSSEIKLVDVVLCE
jgi:hypothetical protein